MKKQHLITKILCLAAFVLVQINAQTAKSETIDISQGNSAVIDGKIEEKEWQDSVKYDLTGGGRVFFKYDGNYVYVAVRGVSAGWSHLYLSEGENADIFVHHASAALGKVVYSKDKNNLWQPLNAFSWELRDRGAPTEGTRKKMAAYLSKNNWAANNNNMGNPAEIEFQLKLQNPAGKDVRLALVYASGPGAPQFFPGTLKDDCLKTELVRGDPPPNIRFDVNQWAKINLKGTAANRPKADDAKDAAEVPDKLFTAMKEKNAEAIRGLFVDGGQLVAIDKPRSGQGLSKTRVFKGEAFAKAISESKDDYIEKMPDKKVDVNGDFAVVYGRYTFYVGEKLSHCGINSFHLVRTETGWKIANGASTLEFNCEGAK